MGYDIFISYSRKDLKQVTAIKSEIELATGAQCWMDLKGGVESGAPQVPKSIIDGIEQSQVFLFMRSAHSQASKYASLEISYANEDVSGNHVVIVNIDDSKMSKEFSFLYKHTDTINWNDLTQREKLLRDLKKWIGQSKGTEWHKDEADRTNQLELERKKKTVEPIRVAMEKLKNVGRKRQQRKVSKNQNTYILISLFSVFILGFIFPLIAYFINPWWFWGSIATSIVIASIGSIKIENDETVGQLLCVATFLPAFTIGMYYNFWIGLLSFILIIAYLFCICFIFGKK